MFLLLVYHQLHGKRDFKARIFKFTNWGKGSEQAILSSVPQVAIRYDIKLIFWGENPGLQLGDMKTVGKTGYDGNQLRNTEYCFWWGFRMDD